MTGSNRRPSACKADALPAELILHLMVTRTGFEPVYACVKGMCVKPLHQRACSVRYFFSLPSLSFFVKHFLKKLFLNRFLSSKFGTQLVYHFHFFVSTSFLKNIITIIHDPDS